MGVFLRALSPRVELIIVILSAFGFFISKSILSLNNHGPGAEISDTKLYILLITEAILFLLVWLFLRLRGWTFKKIGLQFAPVDVIHALALFALCRFAFLLVIWLVHTTGLSFSGNAPLSAGSLSLPSVIAVSVLNPIFEEVFVCGYVISAMVKRDEAWLGIHISIAVRVMYHLYQGAAAAGLIPIGLVFGYWFARTGRLWPVVIAHGLLDFFGFVALMG